MAIDFDGKDLYARCSINEKETAGQSWKKIVITPFNAKHVKKQNETLKASKKEGLLNILPILPENLR